MIKVKKGEANKEQAIELDNDDGKITISVLLLLTVIMAISGSSDNDGNNSDRNGNLDNDQIDDNDGKGKRVRLIIVVIMMTKRRYDYLLLSPLRLSSFFSLVSLHPLDLPSPPSDPPLLPQPFPVSLSLPSSPFSSSPSRSK